MNSQYEQIDSAIPVTQFTTAAKQVTGAILQPVKCRFASSSSATKACPADFENAIVLPFFFLNVLWNTLSNRKSCLNEGRNYQFLEG